MAKKKKSESTPTAAPAPAPAIITKKEPEGWVDQLLARMGSKELDQLEERDAGLRRFVQRIQAKRKDGDRSLTAAELNRIHAAGVLVGLR